MIEKANEAQEDARQLRLHAAGLTYNDTTAEGEAKHRLHEIAMRIETGYYARAALEGQQSPESAPRYTLRQFLIDVVQTGGAAERDVAKAALDLMTGRDDLATNPAHEPTGSGPYWEGQQSPEPLGLEEAQERGFFDAGQSPEPTAEQAEADEQTAVAGTQAEEARDAARYRWLREFSVIFYDKPDEADTTPPVWRDILDRKIDAAMAEEGKP